MHQFNRVQRAFSMIELVIVVVIIGIIAAIAVPRMSRGATGATESTLTANLRVLRNAVELFQTEHDGIYPSTTDVVAQLTTYSNAAGTPSATKTGAFIFGSYINAIPPLPVGAKKHNTGIAAADGAGIGWIYDGAGTIVSNTSSSEVDSQGKKYSLY